MSKRYFNPLTANSASSESSVKKDQVASTSAFNITDPSVCPKCNSATIETKLLSSEPVRFCTNCRVVMALPE
ncbi:hypothetical protein JA33_004 [Dickeya phage vB_DsoM_JA33]|uniref:Transcription factor n=3 Tax=Salmondvirus JA11 TaxID=2734141 RepID=A0A384ZVY7_9CAUD|nr:DNA ligase [Dickeya phage vB_DsoM_JA11]AXG66407.1 hypothetical protein JA13_004 [Dickeya phage vB_DsoM_JA13]AXG67378.1 hypothetical protein JA33_004 [Dickeya phage vB_DsoM_JA33]AYD79809.1 hypothetical protein JA11_004 [Dickeya phage vB_DsoM_JA11]